MKYERKKNEKQRKQNENHVYILLRYLQGPLWTSRELFSQAKEAGPHHPTAFRHEQLGP